MQTKQIGSIRKSKRYKTACGVILGVAFLTAQVAQADELTTTSSPEAIVRTDTSATNLSEPKPENTVEHTQSLADEKKVVGDGITVAVESSALDQAVTSAKEAGVEVSSSTTQTYDNLNQADADLANQVDKVKEATETQKEVSAIQKEAEKEATAAGVTLEKGKPVVYTNQNKAALDDASSQAGNLQTATDTQRELDSTLPTAVKEAKQAGVQVTEEKGKTYKNSQEALADMTEQVAQLTTAKETQAEITNAMAQAVADAKKAGLKVVKGDEQVYDDLKQAKADKDKQVGDLSEAERVMSLSNDTITGKVIEVTGQGTPTKFTGTVEVTVVEADRKTQEIVQSIQKVVSDNQVAQAVYEAKLAETEKYNAGVRQYNAEALAANRKAQADYEKQLAEAQEANAQATAQNDAIAKENEAIRQRNATKQAQYDKDLATYKAEKQRYDEEVAKAEANKGQEGYTNKVVRQSLVYEKEPDAVATTTGQFLSSTQRSDSTEYVVQDGTSLKTVYTNLQNSFFDGKPISKVEIDRTVRISDGSTVNLVIWNDPTAGRTVNDDKGNISFYTEETLRLYDAEGNVIQFSKDKPVAIAMNSLNAHKLTADHVTWGSIEYVGDYNFQFVPIVGSAITEQNGEIYSLTDTDYKIHGSKYDAHEWDGNNPRKPLFYYGSAIGVLESGSEISYKTGNKVGGGQWFAINTDIPALGGIVKYPNEPIKPMLEQEKPSVGKVPLPTAPELKKPLDEVPLPKAPSPAEASYQKLVVTASAHDVMVTAKTHDVDMMAEVHEVKVATDTHPVTIKQAPASSKDAKNELGEDINGNLIVKGSLISWGTGGETLKAGRPQFSKIERTDYLASGQTVDLAKTKASNPDLEFSYDSAKHAVTQRVSSRVLAQANLDQTTAFILPVGRIYATVDHDKAKWENVFTTAFTYADSVIIDKDGKITTKGKENTYKVTSNKVLVETPSTPKPTKDVVDEKGNSINGQSVLPNSTMNYVLKQNFAPYKGINATPNQVAKNFLFIDDYDEKSLDGKSMSVKSILAANGDAVEQLLEMRHVLSQDTLDDTLKELIKESGISPVGEFYMWTVKDPQKFYENYVKKGLDITYNLSFKLNKEFTEGDIINSNYQIDFGNVYVGDTVKNILPVLSIKKMVLDKEDKDIDGKAVKLGDEISYKLEGWVVPANRGYDLWEYRFVDTLQVSHDEYQSYKVYTKVDFTYEGKDYKAGDEIDFSKVTHYAYNPRTGLFELNFNKDFLESIKRHQAFGVDVKLNVKRIAYGEVVNEYKLFVNGNEMFSNKVTTHTPKPQVPVTPTSSNPAPVIPSQPAKAKLPETGDRGNVLAVMTGLLLTGLSLVGLRKKTESK